jgi:6,7-dimethyl-8-ribityllumazine synthase
MASTDTHVGLPAPAFDAPTRLLLVVAPYYRDIAEQLVAGARSAIEGAGGTHEMIEVPGALEIPTAIRIASRDDTIDGFVALGCVIRGETTHYDTVCNDSSRALTLLGLSGLCVGNGILTVETHGQAWVRAEAAGQNKGGGAAIAAMHLIALSRRFAKAGRLSGAGFRPFERAES